MVSGTSCNNTRSNDFIEEYKFIPIAPVVKLIILEQKTNFFREYAF